MDSRGNGKPLNLGDDQLTIFLHRIYQSQMILEVSMPNIKGKDNFNIILLLL